MAVEYLSQNKTTMLPILSLGKERHKNERNEIVRAGGWGEALKKAVF